MARRGGRSAKGGNGDGSDWEAGREMRSCEVASLNASPPQDAAHAPSVWLNY